MFRKYIEYNVISSVARHLIVLVTRRISPFGRDDDLFLRHNARAGPLGLEALTVSRGEQVSDPHAFFFIWEDAGGVRTRPHAL